MHGVGSLLFLVVDDFAFDWAVFFFRVGIIYVGVFGWFFGFFIFGGLLVHLGADWHEFVVQFFGGSFQCVFVGLFVGYDFLGFFDGFVESLLVFFG